MFRHTLASELLGKGATVEEAAGILADSPARIRRHYAKWTPELQARQFTCRAKGSPHTTELSFVKFHFPMCELRRNDAHSNGLEQYAIETKVSYQFPCTTPETGMSSFGNSGSLVKTVMVPFTVPDFSFVGSTATLIPTRSL